MTELASGRRRATGGIRKAASTPAGPATDRPVVRVAVDIPFPHLDRAFDYLVPESMTELVQPGVRVRVRFAGQLTDGYVLDRMATSEHEGALTYLHKVVSGEPVLSPEIAALARAVADHYAGTLSDVLRLAVPPRHARVEAEKPQPPASIGGVSSADDDLAWRNCTGGAEFLTALRRGTTPRAVWTATPGARWPDAIASAAGATLDGGRGSLIVVPDARDVARLDAALTARLGTGRHLTLTADLGPAERYRRFLAVRRGQVRVVVGTRAAMFAPVAGLGLAVIWDDGDDLHAEPHAPYPHVRTVLGLRSIAEGAGLLVGGFACTTEAAQLVSQQWARLLSGSRTSMRDAAPRVTVAGEDDELARDAAARSARLPSVAWRTAADALQSGPVLIQVPRAGYVPALACTRCRTPARCGACSGPIAAAAAAKSAGCGWCGVQVQDWECPSCSGTQLRALAVGAGRTADELGRSFPRVPVLTSGRDGVLSSVGSRPALVVSTPGAEPVAEGGYAAALLLDGWALLGRADLRAGEEALRRWMNAVALVRPGSQGGAVVVMGDASHPAVQALLRWDPSGYAERELSDRSAARLPPAVRMASLTGSRAALQRLLELADLPAPVEVLGPVDVRTARGSAEPGDTERLIIRVPRREGRRLAAVLRTAAGLRSLHKEPGSVRVQIDPLEIT